MSKYEKVKHRIFEIMEQSDRNDKAGMICDIFLISLILLNLVIIIAETFDLPDSVRNTMNCLEIASVILFTIEYILRIWTSPYHYPDMRPALARLKYIFSFMAIVDLLAILPFYMPYFIPLDLRILRLLRVIRLLRIFKINRYTHALNTIVTVFKNKASQLVSSLLVVELLMIIASVLMYNIENSVQPEAFSNAIETMWWAVSTLTTVGYGDVYPITAAGKVLATIIAFLGIGMVAVPTGIITAGFSEITKAQKNDKISYCPYCGHKLDNENDIKIKHIN